MGDVEWYETGLRGGAAELLLPSTVAVAPLLAYAASVLFRSALAPLHDGHGAASPPGLRRAAYAARYAA